MATTLGMSPHRLMHHFGPKDEMVALALARATEMQEEVRDKWLAENPDISQTDLLRKWWKWLSSDAANLALVRLGLEAASLDATVTGLPFEVRAAQIGAWRIEIEERLVSRGVSKSVAAVEASIVKATFTGLVIDLVATGELKRLTKALEQYLEFFDQRLDLLTAR